MIWRWDQGRKTYFEYEAVKNIAPVLVEFHGSDLGAVDSHFRDRLMKETSLPFAPTRYTIKRNYKRVFECSLLATFIGNRLVVSDICRDIASSNPRISTADKYAREVERRFRYPFPAFNNYSEVRTTSYPFLAMSKMLLAQAIRDSNPNAVLSLDEVGSYLIANEITGLEDLDFYLDLKPKAFSFDSYASSDQKRQVREMMAFLGQKKHFHYQGSEIALVAFDLNECEVEFDALKPFEVEITSQSLSDDFLKLTSMDTNDEDAQSEDDEMFVYEHVMLEGNKRFVQHYKTERNPEVRKIYLAAHPEPICDLCGRNLQHEYPWTDYLLEVHHLLPLATSSAEGEVVTRVSDVVGLCPSCHRAVHVYYKQYLKENGQKDFESNEKAAQIYEDIKEEVTVDA